MKHISLLFLCFIFLSISCKNERNIDSSSVSLNNVEIDISQFEMSKLDSLHVRKTMKIYDQSLQSYINSNPNKVTENKKTIYLLPFGNISPKVDSIIRNEVTYLEAFFQIPVKVLPRVSFEEILNKSSVKTRLVPEKDYGYFSKMKGNVKHTENLREQIQANSFSDEYLLKNKPEDAIAVLGITEHDIYNPKYNYLFGSSSLKNGVGIVSTYRLIDYGYESKNTIRKVTSKQIANLFSIKNVKDYECLLNYHSNANSQINGEFKLSPRALEKLKFAIGFDYNKRFSDLEKFWQENNGSEELIEYYKKVQGIS